jgi:hypothetical protein
VVAPTILDVAATETDHLLVGIALLLVVLEQTVLKAALVDWGEMDLVVV